MSAMLEEARTWVGRAASPVAVARDAVNLPMIRRWCEAMGETNPIYTDEAAARAAGHPGIVAPPAMLDVWAMTPYRPEGRAPDEDMAVLKVFDDAGYIGVVATNIEQTYERYLTIGDIVTSTPIVADVSDEKRTGLGIGHFVTLEYGFTVGDEPVGRMLFRVLKFKPNLTPAAAPPPAAPASAEPSPAEPSPAAPTPAAPTPAAPTPAAAPPAGDAPAYSHPRPAITHDNAFFWEGVANRKLLFQSFGGRLRHPPGPMDPVTGSLEYDIVEASGRGTIYSFVIVHQPKLPGLEYPLPIVLVELEEGVRIIANMSGCTPADIAIGKPVVADFIEVEPDYLLPVFRLA